MIYCALNIYRAYLAVCNRISQTRKVLLLSGEIEQAVAELNPFSDADSRNQVPGIDTHSNHTAVIVARNNY